MKFRYRQQACRDCLDDHEALRGRRWGPDALWSLVLPTHSKDQGDSGTIQRSCLDGRQVAFQDILSLSLSLSSSGVQAATEPGFYNNRAFLQALRGLTKGYKQAGLFGLPPLQAVTPRNAAARQKRALITSRRGASQALTGEQRSPMAVGICASPITSAPFSQSQLECPFTMNTFHSIQIHTGPRVISDTWTFL